MQEAVRIPVVIEIGGGNVLLEEFGAVRLFEPVPGDEPLASARAPRPSAQADWEPLPLHDILAVRKKEP